MEVDGRDFEVMTRNLSGYTEKNYENNRMGGFEAEI